MYSNHLNTETWNQNIQLFGHFFVQLSNGLILWLGGPFKNRTFLTINRHFWSGFSDHNLKKQTIWQPDTFGPMDIQLVWHQDGYCIKRFELFLPGNGPVLSTKADRSKRFSQILHHLIDGLWREPNFIFQGRSYNISLGLAVETLGRYSKMNGIFVNELAFFSIHAIERVRTTFLFGLKKIKNVKTKNKVGTRIPDIWKSRNILNLDFGMSSIQLVKLRSVLNFSTFLF